MRLPPLYALLLCCVAALLPALALHALERVAAMPYATSEPAPGQRLPVCPQGQAVSTVGAPAFACLTTPASVPGCNSGQALAARGGSLVCAEISDANPACRGGYAVTDDNRQILNCIRSTEPLPMCANGKILTTVYGRLTCLDAPAGNTLPACAAGQMLTAEREGMLCKDNVSFDCQGRVMRNWNGYNYCETGSCKDNEVLTLANGYLQCRTLPTGGSVHQ